MAKFFPLLDEIRACTTCAESLPHGVRPLLAASPKSRILLIWTSSGAGCACIGDSVVGQERGPAARVARNHERDVLRRRQSGDCADGILLSRDQEAGRPAASARGRSAVASAAAEAGAADDLPGALLVGAEPGR